nr:TRAP transporter small permease [Acuticoccus mangrovi]
MCALLAGVAVAVLSVLIVVDIVSRTALRYSLQGTDELGGYTLALVGSLGLPYALMRRGHPRVDIFLRRFPRRARAALHVLAYAALAGFAIFMTVHAVAELRTTLTYGTITNTPLQTPLAWPQALWVAGTGFFALTASILTLDALRRLFLAPATVEAVYGPLSVEDEVGEYVEDKPMLPRSEV